MTIGRRGGLGCECMRSSLQTCMTRNLRACTPLSVYQTNGASEAQNRSSAALQRNRELGSLRSRLRTSTTRYLDDFITEHGIEKESLALFGSEIYPYTIIIISIIRALIKLRFPSISIYHERLYKIYHAPAQEAREALIKTARSQSPLT